MQPPSSIGKYFLPGFILICTIVLLDQYTKWLVIETVLRLDGPASNSFYEWLTTSKKIAFFIDQRESFKALTVTPFLNFVMVWNQGISFGMLDTNSSGMSLALIAVSLMASILMMIWLALCSQKMLATALSLIVGGALANVLDRVRFGAVADFIDVHANSLHWPAFNVADSCIVIGAMFLLIDSLFNKNSNPIKVV